MKTLLLVSMLACLVLVSGPVSAEQINNPAGAYSVALFTNYTGYGLGGATTRYSAVQKVDRDTRKTVILQGFSSGTTETSSLAGTVTLQCCRDIGADACMTAKDQAATAVTATTSTLFDMNGLCQYFRATYLKSAAGAPNISVYLLYGGP